LCSCARRQRTRVSMGARGNGASKVEKTSRRMRMRRAPRDPPPS
jgi:hypothetical protein